MNPRCAVLAAGGVSTAREPAAIILEIERLLDALREALTSQPPGAGRARPGPVLDCGPLVLDTARMRVSHAGATVSLTSRELLLLRYFLERPGQVISRERLLVDVWDYRYTGDPRTV